MSETKTKRFGAGTFLVAIAALILGAGCSDSETQSRAPDGGNTMVDAAAPTAGDAAAPTEGDAASDAETIEPGMRPVVFVHGGSGSATQFESQAQRFMSNGYPREYLVAYEHPTGPGAPAPEDQIDGLDAIIDAVLADTGADRVDVISHSRGGGVCFHYLESSAERAAKVAHYVVVDSQTGLELTMGMDRTPGNVQTLALWGEGDPARTVEGATNVYLPDQAHIEMCTAATSFVEMYEFFNGEAPSTDTIEEAAGDEIEITGRVVYFPQNEGALGNLEIYEVDPDTGYRLGDEPVGEWTVDASGEWGPQTLEKGASYEYAFEHTTGARHNFYREPFFANDYFVRLLTSTADGIGTLMTQTPDHVDIVVQRDKEFWGDQGADNDVLVVDGTSVATELAAAREKRLSGLFLLDWGPGAHAALPEGVEIDFTGYELGASNLDQPIAIFHGIGFISGIDLFMPAASPPDRTIELRLTPRGGGPDQVVNIPNWASDEVRVSVGFRDFSR